MVRSHVRWPDLAYASLETILRQRAGLVFQSLRRSTVEAAATRIMDRVGLGSAELFLPLLNQDGAVFDDLMAEVTIGETYFFREVGHFTLMREHILPEFRKREGDARRFRAWSAGAATGEEAYSIAITLQEEGVAGDVIATDISRARLAAARRATYRAWSFRGVPEATIERYFKRDGDSFVLSPTVRRDVEFRYLNLASDLYPALSSGVWGMDVIFCRNVLIYFDRDTIAHVAAALFASLADDGWIVMGATDPPLNEFVSCEVVQTKAGLAYRRARAGGLGSRMLPPVVALPVAIPVAPPPPAPPPPRPVAPPEPVAEPAIEPQASSGIAPANTTDVADSATAFAARVRALANAGRLDEAGRDCAIALDVHRENPELHYLHAVLVAQAGQFAESARAAKRALYLDRSMIVAHSALGTVLAKSGNAVAARRAFATATRLLEAMAADAIVPYSDGEPAIRLLEMTRVQSRLLPEGDA